MGSIELVTVFGILACAAMSFFFALAESALFALGRWQAKQMAERTPLEGQIVLRLLSKPAELLATIVLGNTLANALIAAIALRQALLGNWSLPATIGTLLILILGGCEIVPKSLAVRSPEAWAKRVARPMLYLQGVAEPLHRFVQWFNTRILRLLLVQPAKASSRLTEEEYSELLEMAFQQGTLKQSEKEIILQIISLDKKKAGDVMTPRSQMNCIPDDLSVPEMIEAARKYKHRRLPIYDETPDTIVGVLNTRALLLNPEIDMADAIEFPSFVPESMNLLHLLRSLQRQRREIAIVLDEFGGTAGVVTMADILEDVVGEIHELTDSTGFTMEKLGPGRWRVAGSMWVDDFRQEYPELADVNGVETMGGLVLNLIEAVPAVGESAYYRGLKLTVRAATDRRVRELLVETTKRRS